MPGAKNERQALRSHTPALSRPGEGVNLSVSALVLSSEKIDSLADCGRGYSAGGLPNRSNGGDAMKLANKVAVITGAGSGMGQAAAVLFAAEGAAVAAVDV